jgi:hypothetical protein
MTTSHGREGHPQYGIWGPEGDSVGRFAFNFREYLWLPDKEMPFAPGETPRWNSNDREVFASLIDLESALPSLEQEDVVQGRDLHALFPNLRLFHDVLPFSDKERHWLTAGHRRDMYGLFDTEAIHSDDGIPFDAGIIATGEPDRMPGGDMVRRWAAWRREVDEFAGREILSQAGRFLNLLGRELVHEQEWPQSTR